MAMIQCNKHGLVGAASVCVHIVDWVKSNKQFKFIKIEEELFDSEVWPHFYCDQCSISFGLSEGQLFDELPDELNNILVPVCGKCFNEAQGHG